MNYDNLEIECTIKELHDFIKENSIDLLSNNIEVLSKKNNDWSYFVRIEACEITEKNSFRLELHVGDFKLICSPNHRVLTLYGFENVEKLKENDFVFTTNGFEKVRNIKKLNTVSDLYDLQVESGEYFTNGILSHNSTINLSILYSLYGKANKKKVTEIANRINKNLQVEINVTTKKNNNVIIKRGNSPNYFDVEIDGVMLDIAGKLNVQEILERDYFEIPYYVFNNILSLSINDFKSFINMSPSDKRSIIDRILGMEILNKINEYIKSLSKITNEQIERYNYELNFLNSNIDSTLNKIEESKQERGVGEEDKFNNLQEFKNKIEESIVKLKNNALAIKEKFNESNKLSKTIEHKIIQLKTELKQIESKKKLFEQDKCPTCEMNLNNDFHKNLLSNYINLETQLKLKLQILTTELDGIHNTINSIIETIKNVENKILLLQKKKISTEAEIKFLSINNLENVGILNSLLEETNLKLEDVKNKIADELAQKGIFSILEMASGDKGVKQKILSYILPAFNSSIAQYLKELNLNFNIIFKEDFNSVISHLGDVISTDSLSLGEIKKIDFVVLLSLIKLFKTKFQNLNLIFLDEIFSSVDEEGKYQIVKILSKFAQEELMHIFVINHSEMPKEYFTNIYEITKSGEFSQISVIK